RGIVDEHVDVTEGGRCDVGEPACVVLRGHVVLDADRVRGAELERLRASLLRQLTVSVCDDNLCTLGREDLDRLPADALRTSRDDGCGVDESHGSPLCDG